MTEESSEDRIYAELREFLDRLPGGYPATDSGVELRILKKLFTPEEAKMAVHLSLEPQPVPVIAERCGREESEAGEMLESMAVKGLVFRIREGDKVLYQAAQFNVGFYDFQVKTIDKELAEMIREYMRSWDTTVTDAATRQFRVVPVSSAVEVTHAVATYDRVRDLVRAHKYIAVEPCMCRNEQRLMGHDCGRPLENCLSFGDFARYYIENGWGREISQEEALRILDNAEESALVLCPTNTQEAAFICSCCGCCCGVLRRLKSLPDPGEVVVSSFWSRIDPDLCSACGECLERCQMDAIVEGEGFMEVNKARCIGCGLCLTSCPEDAVSLQMKPEVEAPPADWDETMARILKERGLS